MKILHIHQDYPDKRPYPFTKAVHNLVIAAPKYNNADEHFVLSINRTSNPLRISFKEFDDGLSIVYWALPLPIVYRPVLFIWSLIISLYLKPNSFDIIHAHKLTTEGVFSYYLSKLLKIPYVISVRGGSDVFNLKRFWDLKKFYSKIYSQSQHLFWVSPWAKPIIENSLGCINQNNSIFPNICHIDNISNNPAHNDRKRYCTVLSYHQLKRKGLMPLLQAIKTLKNNGEVVCLDIIGGGDDTVKNDIQKTIFQLGIDKQVDIIGEVTHHAVLEYFKTAKGLLLPSVNETFGMAYIEALACGAPILYMKNTGVDGYFNLIDVGAVASNQDEKSIIEALRKLEQNSQMLMKNVSDLNLANEFTVFTEQHLVKSYLTIMEDIHND